MTFKFPSDRGSRLKNLIEVEITREDGAAVISHIRPEKHDDDGDPLAPLDELVKKMQELEAHSPQIQEIPDENRDEALGAISEMQRNLDQFRKQNAILKRLLTKYH